MEAHSGQESPGERSNCLSGSTATELTVCWFTAEHRERTVLLLWLGTANVSCKMTFFPHGSLRAWPAATAVFLSQDSKEVLFFTGQ